MSAPLRSILVFVLGAAGALAQGIGVPASTVSSAALVPALGSPYIIGPQTTFVASGDFNGDGLPDLALASTPPGGMTLTVLLAKPDGGFQAAPGGPLTFPSVAYNHNILGVADFNGDGKLDIAFLAEKALQVLLGDGHGGFTSGPMSPILLSPFGSDVGVTIGVGDFNHDNKPDLIIGDFDANAAVAVLIGDGTGNFSSAPGSAPHIGHSVQMLTVADFNLDGHLDVALTNTGSVDQVFVLLGDGTGRFSPDPKGPFPTGQTPIWIDRADFNGDGRPDLAVVNWFVGTLTILLGDGAGGFVREPDIVMPPGYILQSIVAGDIDGDGIADLVVPVANQSDSGFYVLLGDGRGGFHIAASGIVENSGGNTGIAIADFNGDGRLDIATANSSAGTASVFLGAATAASSLTVSASAASTVGVPFAITVAANTSGFRAPTGAVTVRDGATVVGSGNLVDGAFTFQTTMSTAVAHTLVAVYLGDARITGSASQPLTINVAKGSQIISFPAVPNHHYGDAPFTVPVSSSSGLPVTLTVLSGPATVAGNVLTLTGSGTVALRASQPGDANYLPAADVDQQLQIAAPLLHIDSILNAASYGAGGFAPGSFAVVFGAGLASQANDTSIKITDGAGKSGNALLYYVSPAQINFIFPSGLSQGTATLVLQIQSGISTTAQISIAAVEPGLFSADASGTGVAAGSALRVAADGTQTPLPIDDCSGPPLVCTAIPIDLGSDSDKVYLVMYGTGIRGRSALAAVTATIGGIASNVLFADAQPQYPGLDQVNLVIDPTLRGRGKVDVVLKVDGVAANVLSVAIQ